MAVTPTAEVRVKTVADRASLRRTEKEITKSLAKVEQLSSRGGLLGKSYTQPLGKITGAVGEFEKSLEASNARVIAFGASAGVIYNVSRAIEGMTRSAIDLEHKLAEINVILNASSSGLQKFGDQLFNIAKNTGQTFDDVSISALEFARQGLAVEETLKRTSDAMILVRLAGLDVKSSVEAVTATINSFNQTIISSTELVNKLANVDAAFAVSSADLAKAVSRVGSSAQDAGVGLDELIAMVTTAQQVTARGGSVIGNSLKTIFTRIQRPAVISNLEAFGVAVRDAQGATLPAIQVLQNFADSYQRLTPMQRAVTAEMVGGVFQVNVLKAALGDLGKEFSIYDRALATSVGSTDEAIQRNAALNQTLKTLTNETMVNLLKVGAKVGEITIAPTLKNALQEINKALEDLEQNAEAETLGSKMGKGVLEGIGAILKGPGMIVLGALVGKLLFSFSKFSVDAVRTFAGWNESAKKQAEMQMLIQNILLKNPELIAQAASGEQNLVRIEEKILEVIRARNIALSQSADLSAAMARNLNAADLRAMNTAVSSAGATEGSWRPVAARGFIPNYSSNKKERGMSETVGAIQAGYTPGAIKEMGVQGVGRVTYNSAEKVKKFNGMSQPAIMPPERSDAGKAYKDKFANKHGFDPYAAYGFIPNFRPSVIDVKARKYHDGDWKKATASQKDLAISKYLKDTTKALSEEGSSITAWRTKEGISQGAVTNWINDRKKKNSTGALANLGPLSEAQAKVLVPIITKHQKDNVGKNIKEGNIFEDQIMEHFGIGVGTKGARNVSFDFVGPSAIPTTADANELKKKIDMSLKTVVGDAHVAAGHSHGLFVAKYLRHYTGHARGRDGKHAASIAEAFYPSNKRRKGIHQMDVEQQFGDSEKLYTDVLGAGSDKQVRATPTVWSVARDNWANLKKELLKRTNEKQIKKDKKKFLLEYAHDSINKTALNTFKGFIPNFATKILDKDQLAQQMGVPLASRQAKQMFESIVKQAAQRGQINETIVGTAGIGKTTEAIKRAGGPNFITDPVDLDPSDQLVVVRAAQTVVDSPEFTKAGKITFLKGAKEVVESMRKKRSGQIRAGTSDTAFGRGAKQQFGKSSGIVTEALLAEKYASKLSVFERQADMSLKEAAEFEKLNEIKGGVATIGAFAPFTKGHADMAGQAGASVAFVSKGAGREFDVGLSPKEKAKLIELANPKMMAVPSNAGVQEHFEHGGKAYRMKRKDTKIALGADRVSGGEEDLTNRFSKTYKGVVPVAGRLDGVSGTKIRQAIINGDLNTLKNNLPPEVFRVIRNNIPVLKKRASYIQDRKDKAGKGLEILEQEFAKFKGKHGNKRKGELSEITEAREMFKGKRAALKKRVSGYGGRAWKRLGLQMNFASEGFVPSLAYKGLHEKDFGTTMVGRKGAMGKNMTDKQVKKMTAGMKMIRGPEGETLILGTDMKGRSGRMIATGLTSRKIKKSGAHWRTMLNEVPHLFDGLAYDLVGGVAGADWDPEGASGAMAGVKFENEMAASLGAAKPGAKKGSDITLGEKAIAKLKTQKNLQLKLALHERSKRDPNKIVDIASSFSKYLVDILSHNIKTQGLSSVTTPDRFQQAMGVLNANPAVKKDWGNYFGPMGMKAVGHVPNFARDWKSQGKNKHSKFKDGKQNLAQTHPGIFPPKGASHGKFKEGQTLPPKPNKGINFGGFVPNFYADSYDYQRLADEKVDEEHNAMMAGRNKASWETREYDGARATTDLSEASISAGRIAAAQNKALRAMGVPEFLSDYGTGRISVPPPGKTSFNVQDKGQRDRLKDKHGLKAGSRPTFNAVYNEEDARRNVARRKHAIRKGMSRQQFGETFQDHRKSSRMDNTTELRKEQRKVSKKEISAEIHNSATGLAVQYGKWGSAYGKGSAQTSYYNDLEGVFKQRFPDYSRILLTSTEDFVNKKGLAHKKISGNVISGNESGRKHGTNLSHELVASSNPELKQLESVDFMPTMGGDAMALGMQQVQKGKIDDAFGGRLAQDQETIQMYTKQLEDMVIHSIGAKAFSLVASPTKMEEYQRMRSKDRGFGEGSLKRLGAYAEGLIPNYSREALRDAIGREKAAGQGQPRVGYDSRLRESGGVGVYNTTEGSLSNAINMHLAGGNTIGGIQAQGASDGRVPNFAGGMDTAMMMGSLSMLAFTMKDFAGQFKELTKPFDEFEKAIEDATEAVKKAEEAENKKVAEMEASADSLPTAEPAKEAEAKASELRGQAGREAAEATAAVDEAKAAPRAAEEEAKRLKAEIAATKRAQKPGSKGRKGKTSEAWSSAKGKAEEQLKAEGVKTKGVDGKKAVRERAKKLLQEQEKELKKQLEATKGSTEAAIEKARNLKRTAKATEEEARKAEANAKSKKTAHKAKIASGAKEERANTEAAKTNLKAAENNLADAKKDPANKLGGKGGRAMKWLEGGGASSMMIAAPMMASMASQGFKDKETKAMVEGGGQAVGMAATGAQMGAALGPYGALAGAVIGLGVGAAGAATAMEKAALQKKMDEIGKSSDLLGEKLNKVTSGGQAYMEGLDKLNSMMADTTGKVKPEDLAKVRSKMAQALGDVPQEFQRRFREAAGDAEKIKEIFGEITQELATAKADLDAAKTGYGLQQEFATGASAWYKFGFGRDRTLFERGAGGQRTAESDRIQASFKGMIGGGLDKKAIEEAMGRGENIDFRNLNARKLSQNTEYMGEGFTAFMRSVSERNTGGDLAHMGNLIQDFIDRIASGRKEVELAEKALAAKQKADKVYNENIKLMTNEMDKFQQTIGVVVNSTKRRMKTLVDMSNNIKSFMLDFNIEGMKGARKLSEPFETKGQKIAADLGQNIVEIRTKSIKEFQKAITGESKKNLDTLLSQFQKNSEALASKTSALSSKDSKEILGELARSRTAQQAMLPVVEEAFQVFSQQPNNSTALLGVASRMAKILENNGIAGHKARAAANLILQQIKSNGRESVEKLSLSLQKMTQQIAIAQEQAHWAKRAADMQARIASFGGQGQIFGTGGTGGFSKAFDGLKETLTMQIKGAVSDSIVDMGRAQANLLDKLLNTMNLDTLRKNLEGLAPMLSGAIAGRTRDIQKYAGTAGRIARVASPGIEVPKVDAEQIATEEIAAKLKLNQLPDEVSAIRRNTAITNLLLKSQTTKLTSNNKKAFSEALRINAIPENMRKNVLAGKATAQGVDGLGGVNQSGFAALIGGSIEVQQIAAALPDDFATSLTGPLGSIMGQVRDGLRDAIGKINTNIQVEFDSGEFASQIQNMINASQTLGDLRGGSRIKDEYVESKTLYEDNKRDNANKMAIYKKHAEALQEFTAGNMLFKLADENANFKSAGASFKEQDTETAKFFQQMLISQARKFGKDSGFKLDEDGNQRFNARNLSQALAWLQDTNLSSNDKVNLGKNAQVPKSLLNQDRMAEWESTYGKDHKEGPARDAARNEFLNDDFRAWNENARSDEGWERQVSLAFMDLVKRNVGTRVDGKDGLENFANTMGKMRGMGEGDWGNQKEKSTAVADAGGGWFVRRMGRFQSLYENLKTESDHAAERFKKASKAALEYEESKTNITFDEETGSFRVRTPEEQTAWKERMKITTDVADPSSPHHKAFLAAQKKNPKLAAVDYARDYQKDQTAGAKQLKDLFTALRESRSRGRDGVTDKYVNAAPMLSDVPILGPSLVGQYQDGGGAALGSEGIKQIFPQGIPESIDEWSKQNKISLLTLTENQKGLIKTIINLNSTLGGEYKNRDVVITTPKATVETPQANVDAGKASTASAPEPAPEPATGTINVPSKGDYSAPPPPGLTPEQIEERQQKVNAEKAKLTTYTPVAGSVKDPSIIGNMIDDKTFSQPQGVGENTAEIIWATIQNHKNLAFTEIIDAAKKAADTLDTLGKDRLHMEEVHAMEMDFETEGGTVSTDTQDALKAKHEKEKEALNMEERIALLVSQSLGVLAEGADQEKKRVDLLSKLKLKQIDINSLLSNNVTDYEKLAKLIGIQGDLLRDVAADKVIQALAEAKTLPVMTGKSSTAIQKGVNSFQEAIFSSIGGTDVKQQISDIRSRAMEQLKAKRGDAIDTGEAGKFLQKWFEDTMENAAGTGDEGASILDAFTGMDWGDDIKEWAANNQNLLMEALDAAGMSDEQMNQFRKMMAVLSEEEALRMSINNILSESNVKYKHQLDLFHSGVGTFQELTTSFNNLKGATRNAGKLLDPQSIKANLRATAQNTAETFTHQLHEAMNGAMTGSALKTALDTYMRGLVENPEMANFMDPATGDQARQDAINEVKAQQAGRAREAAKEEERLWLNAAQAEKDLINKKRGANQKNIDEAWKAHRQHKAEQARLNQLDDAKIKTYSQDPSDYITQAANQSFSSMLGELTRSQDIFNRTGQGLNLVNEKFNALNEAAKAGNFGKDFEAIADMMGTSSQDLFVDLFLVDSVKRSTNALNAEMDLLEATLRRDAAAAAAGSAGLQALQDRYVKFGNLMSDDEKLVARFRMESLASETAAKYGRELSRLSEIYEDGTMASDKFRQAIDEANEAAMDAGDYGVKNFTNSLLGGFLYSSRDFYTDLNNMAKEFSQDFRTGVASAFGEAIRGTKDLKEAFGDMLKDMADKMLDKTLQMGVNSIFDAIMPNPSGYSTGGMVRGGSGTKDDVPAYLSRGEYVVRKSSVDAYGQKFFESLNSGKVVQAAEGGRILGGMSKDRQTAVQIAMMRRAEAKRQRELSAAGISQFSYREADPDKKKEDWLGRETSEPVINTKSDYRVDLKAPINSERIKAIKGVLEKYPDVGKNIDREMFDESSVEVGAGKYKAHLKNKFIFDNLKRPENAHMLTDSGLSANALTDENNPQNRYKFEKMDAFFGYQHERMEFLKDQQEAMEKYHKEKEARRWGFLFGSASLLTSAALTGGKGGYNAFAKGGQNVDDLPALLTGGEYVVKKDIVDKYGTEFFDRLNNGTMAQYATGGLVTRPHTMSPVRSTNQSGNSVSSGTGSSIDQTNNINITVNVDSNGAVSGDTTESGGSGVTPLNEKETKELASKIKGTVLSTLIQEKKPGGMLYERK